MTPLRVAACLLALAAAPFPVLADDDDGDRRGRRSGSGYQQHYLDDRCKVERKQENNGGFEEKIDCKGGYGRPQARSEFKEEFRDGNCKVKRELKKDGDYHEERKCKGPSRAQVRGPAYALPQPVVVVPQPVYLPPPVVVEPGVVIQGTIRVK